MLVKYHPTKSNCLEVNFGVSVVNDLLVQINLGLSILLLSLNELWSYRSW
jgi:hypothetical protein